MFSVFCFCFFLVTHRVIVICSVWLLYTCVCVCERCVFDLDSNSTREILLLYEDS